MKNKLTKLSVAAAFTAAMAVGASANGLSQADSPAVHKTEADRTTVETVNKKPLVLASSGGTVHGV